MGTKFCHKKLEILRQRW